MPKQLVCRAKSKPFGNLTGLLERHEIEQNFLNTIITGDESWMFEYDLRDKPAKWGMAKGKFFLSKKSMQSRSRVKGMIVLKKFLPSEWMVNQAL